MVDASVCHQSQCAFIEELPEDDILVHSGRLELCLVAQIEYLEGPGLGFEGDDESIPVHDSAIRFDRPSNDIVTVFEIDNDNFRGCNIINFLSYANVSI